MYRTALCELADKLDPARSVRVRRSAIVSMESVAYLEPMSRREFEAVLRSGARRRVSRTYRPGVGKALGQSLWVRPSRAKREP